MRLLTQHAICYQAICRVLLTSQLSFRKNRVDNFVNGEGDDAPSRKAKVNLHGCRCAVLPESSEPEKSEPESSEWTLCFCNEVRCSVPPLEIAYVASPVVKAIVQIDAR